MRKKIPIIFDKRVHLRANTVAASAMAQRALLDPEWVNQGEYQGKCVLTS